MMRSLSRPVSIHPRSLSPSEVLISTFSDSQPCSEGCFQPTGLSAGESPAPGMTIWMFEYVGCRVSYSDWSRPAWARPQGSQPGLWGAWSRRIWTLWVERKQQCLWSCITFNKQIKKSIIIYQSTFLPLFCCCLFPSKRKSAVGVISILQQAINF